MSWKSRLCLLIHEFLNTSCNQSSIRTTDQANTIHAFEVLACGNPNHNLEVVSTPKPTAITLLLAMSIFSPSRLGVCERLPFLSWSVLLSHFNMLLTSILFRLSSQTSTTTRLFTASGPNSTAALSWPVFLFSLHPSTLVCMCHLMAAIPFISLLWLFIYFSALLRDYFSFAIVVILLTDLSVLRHILHYSSPRWPVKDLQSVIIALCCVLRPRPALICAGRFLAPAASIFTLWFSPWPPSWLQAGALLSPHPGGRRTHLSHFWVSACCMFCGVAERNNVAWRNSRSPSRHTLSQALPALASPESDVGSHSLKP